jgi:aminoglycoside phosphotransferase (APT) family kinase protein
LHPGRQNDQETYRLFITRRNGSELLCLPDGQRHSLPSVEIPRWERVAEQINDAVKDQFHFDAYSSFTYPLEPPANQTSSTLFQVMECIHPDGRVPPTAFWVPVTSLTDASFADEEDFLRICDVLRILGPQAARLDEGPFVKPGWLNHLCSWIRQAIEPRKLRLTGNFRQLNASPAFSLIRFETTGAAVWFKAVGKPNIHEFKIVSVLTALLAAYLPRIIAFRPEWNAWLMTEEEGTSPRADSDLQTWRTVAVRLAELQIASLQETPRLMAAGCRDVSLSALLNSADDFFTSMDKAMKQQYKTPPSTLSSVELFHLKKQIKEAIRLLATTGIPDALNHLDFNPGNIFVSGDQCTFIDWAEAAIGHPFLTFEYLLEHLRRLCPVHENWHEELAPVYSSEWERFATASAVSRSLALAPLTAVFAYAVSTSAWRQKEVLASPRTAGYFRSLVRRMKREADALEERSLKCTAA